MFKRKQDVDKHVSSILSRKRNEKERHAQGFQIARLYTEIKEYTVAKKYLSGFLQVREKAPPQAYQLMGEIDEALGNQEVAIESYKRALDLGGFGSTHRHLLLKICELYCDIGTDAQRFKYWLDKCEQCFPKSEVVFKMKTQLAYMSSGDGNSTELESLITAELLKRPTDLSLRIQLLKIYQDSQRYSESYSAAMDTDLTMAFTDSLEWFETLQAIFEIYHEQVNDSSSDHVFQKHYLHVLRNVTYLRLASGDVKDSTQALARFDCQLCTAFSLASEDEGWTAFIRELKGQLFYLAGLLLLKRAQNGAITWSEANKLSGACFLASRDVEPLDPQAPWFVRASQNYSKFYNSWYQLSYDRLSQVGHMINQLSQGKVFNWSKELRLSTMTTQGHEHLVKTLYHSLQPAETPDEGFLIYSASELVGNSELKEPLTERQLIDIDRVATQTHLDQLSHLVWLCLQRYTVDIPAQPNYHFGLMENIQYSVKKLDSGGGESLCQLDILVFLLASVHCAATAVSQNAYRHDDARPLLLPQVLSKALCSPEQEDWWLAVFKFCTNTVKTDFSRLRQVLVRGIETVRLISPGGMSVPMIVHVAKSLDAKAKSLKESEFGCRCPLHELTALEARAAFYWERVKKALVQIQRNINLPVTKNRLFKEADDLHIPSRLINQYLAEVNFALALYAMRSGHPEIAIEGFSTLQSPWAKFYCAQMYKLLGEREEAGSENPGKKTKSLYTKARECLYEVLDRLGGDREHELRGLVTREVEDVEDKINGMDWPGNEAEDRDIFHTPLKSPPSMFTHSSTKMVAGSGHSFIHSTPRPVTSASNLLNGARHNEESAADANTSITSTVSEVNGIRARPSPERLDCQIKSLSNTQASLFKMVLDRNEELILINGKMMEELRDNNTQLKNVLSKNGILMQELKAFLGDNRDMMKQIKTELSGLKPSLMAAVAPPPVPMPHGATTPGHPIFIPPHMTPQGPPQRGPYTGFPPGAGGPPMMPPAYGYLLNSATPIPTPSGPRLSGLPGQKSSTTGKYKGHLNEEEEEVDSIIGVDEALLAECCNPDYCDSDYSQYFAPDASQEWSLASRTGMESQLAMPPLQQRMGMPAPGYFAAALRGQALQYPQVPGMVKTLAPGPGYFSSPVTATPSPRTPIPGTGVSHISVVGTTMSGSVSPSLISPSGAMAQTQSPALKAALTGQWPIAAGTVGNLESTPSIQSTTSVSDKIHTQSRSSSVTAKPNLGGFTFSGTPTVVTPGTDKERVKAESHKSPPVTAKDTLKPFASFALTAPSGLVVSSTGTPLFQGKSPSGSVTVEKSRTSAGDEEGVEEYEPNVEFKPVIALPELVDKKTGEENEDELFLERCRLFRFDPELKSWKERGVGEMKILKSKLELKFRIIMRRDQILKLCANHSLTADMRLTPMAKSDRSWCYSAHDFSEEEIKMEQLAVKFKTAEKATVFQKVFEDSVSELKVAGENTPQTKGQVFSTPDQSPAQKTVTTSPSQKTVTISPGTRSSSSTVGQSLSQFKPKAGSWECSSCLIRNKADTMKCLACQIIKPGVKPEDIPKDPMQKSNFSTPSAEGFRFGSWHGPSSGDLPQAEATTASANKPLSELFKPKAGSWECGGCLLRNPADIIKCRACATVKPGVKPEDLPNETSLSAVFAPASGGSFRFGGAPVVSSAALSTGGFMFGGVPDVGSSAPSSGDLPQAEATTASANKPLSELFKPKAGSWECGGCLVRNPADIIKCPACATVKPGGSFRFGGAPVVSSAAPSTGGFKFGGAPSGSTTGTSGFRFGSQPVAASQSTSASNENGAAAKFRFGQSVGASQEGFSFKPTAGLADSGPNQVSVSGAPSVLTAEAPQSSSGKSSAFSFGSSPATSPFAPAAIPRTSGPTASPFDPAAVPSNIGSTTFPFASAALPSTSGSGTSLFAPSAVNSGPGKPPFAPAALPSTSGSGTSLFAPSAVNSGLGTSPFAPAVLTSTSGSAASAFAAPGSANASFSFTAKPGMFSFTQSKEAATMSSNTSEPCGSGLLAKLLTSDESAVDEMACWNIASKPAASASPSGFSFTLPPKMSSTPASSSQGFAFSFAKSPPKTNSSSQVVPRSPEVNEQGMYVNKEGDDSHIHFEPVVALPEKIEVKTGEEDESVLFEFRGKMYRFVSGEWKEKGVGVVKILQHNDTLKTRVLMRRDQVLKICCNHKIDASLLLQPMASSEGKAWVWYAMDFSEGDGKVEQLALRFRTAETASEFKKVFEECSHKASPVKGDDSTDEVIGDCDALSVKKELFAADSTTMDDDDVIFIKEESPTSEQVSRAHRWQLPDTFYLYESKPPCPGCIGCEDDEGTPSKTNVLTTWSLKPATKEFSKPAASLPSVPLFGSGTNLPNFASLTSDSDGDTASGDTGNGGGFTFNADKALDFSSVASSGQDNVFAYKQSDSSPFHFAGAGQKLFGTPDNASGNEDRSREMGVVSSDDVHFEPVIPLPDLIEVKTGEEDWNAMFCQRAKLYKFDHELSQWKERGIGQMKIMKHKTLNLFRLLQRREQVLKVSCNHLILEDMELKPMATSETSWCWLANDFSDTETSIEQFAVKFKSKEIALEFKTLFESCQEQLKQTSDGSRTCHRSLREDVVMGLNGVPTSTQNIPSSANHGDRPDMTSHAMTVKTCTPLGGGGNIYHSKALDVSGADVMSATTYTQLGDKDDVMTVKTCTPLGDRGNIYHSKALDVSGADVSVSATTYTQLGDKDDVMMVKTCTPPGDSGNIYHSKAVGGTGFVDLPSSMSQSQSSHTAPLLEPSLTTPDPMTPQGGSCPLTLDMSNRSSNTSASAVLTGPAETSSQQQQQQQQQEVYSEEEGDNDDEEGDNDDEEGDNDDEDEEEDEKVLFEKRVTLSRYEHGAWKKLGLGSLQVIYNEDLNGNSVRFQTDEGECLCSHIICREHKIHLDSQNKTCEWEPVEYSTDEPMRKCFSASFSSSPAAEEFAKIFDEGQRLAVDSELSENLSREIDVPEIFSGGEPAE